MNELLYEIPLFFPQNQEDSTKQHVECSHDDVAVLVWKEHEPV